MFNNCENKKDFIAAKNVIAKLHELGYEAWLVGGCVRDFLIGNIPHDYDVTTSADPVSVMGIFKHVADSNGIEFGTVMVTDDGEMTEVTTYRAEGAYKDGRHPDEIEFVNDIKDDLARRDFTMNAIAYNTETEETVDPFGGMNDIKNGIIRAVGNPDTRFQEDALRILRAMRFSSVLGFMIEEKTTKAMFANKSGLQKISKERITSEMKKILLGRNRVQVLLLFRDIIAEIFPEMLPAIQSDMQYHIFHIYNVYEHIVHSLNVKTDNVNVIFALLFHDIAKPGLETHDDNGVSHFKGHAEESAKIAKDICKRYKMDNKSIDEICFYISNHDILNNMTTEDNINRSTIRRLISKYGNEAFYNLMTVIDGDSAGQNPFMQDSITKRNLAVVKIAEDIIRNNDAFQIKDMKVNGYDVMNAGFKGKDIGDELQSLFDKVMNGEKNERGILLNILEEDKNKKIV